jgi:hypothetical protein
MLALPNRLCGLVVRVPGYRFRGPGFDSRRCQIFWEVMGLERGPHSLERITVELLERNRSGSRLDNRINNGRGISLRWPRDTLYPLKLALTSPTNDSRSVGIVRLRTKVTEYVSVCLLSKGLNKVGVPHLKTETDPVSETLCFLVFKILEDGYSPKTR